MVQLASRRPAKLRRGRAADRGAALVEAAMVTPLLVLLVFGIIEFGLLFKDTSSVAAAAASGARTAATQARTNGYQDNVAAAVTGALSSVGATPQELVVYRVEKNGLNQPVNWSSAQITGCSTCYKFTWSGGQWVPSGGSGWAAAAQQACGPVATTDYVGVWIKARHDMLTGMFGSARTITEKTVMRLEPVPGDCR